MFDSLTDFLFDSERHRNKRRYSKTKIKDLDFILKMKTTKIEEDPEKVILDVLNKNREISLFIVLTLTKM
jgi:hypothetical protein